MNYLLLIIFALSPSFIWLLFFLRKDAHPESNPMILKVFFWGMLSTLPLIAFFILLEVLNFNVNILKLLPSLIIIRIFGMALIEEVLKYLVVSGKVLKSSELDEPPDIILYMIIAALGFAALENILYLLQLEDISDIFKTSVLRFLAPVLGHALWSGTLGYFLALSVYEPKKKLKLLTLGFALTAFLHGAFNYVIIHTEKTGNLAWISLIIIMLIGLVIFVTLGFKKLQKIKSVCKIN